MKHTYHTNTEKEFKAIKIGNQKTVIMDADVIKLGDDLEIIALHTQLAAVVSHVVRKSPIDKQVMVSFILHGE